MHDRVIGALFGEQRGADSVVMNSIEMHFDLVEGTTGQQHAIINADFVRKQETMHKVVYPKQDLLGWYAVGEQAEAGHMVTHKALAELGFNNPLFLLLNDRIDEGAKELPLSIYEGQVAVVADTPKHVFVRQAFAIATTESERIAIEHVAKVTPIGGDESTLTPHLSLPLKVLPLTTPIARQARNLCSPNMSSAAKPRWVAHCIRHHSDRSNLLGLLGFNHLQQSLRAQLGTPRTLRAHQ